MSGRKVFVSSDMSVDERLLLVSEKNGMASLLWPWLLTALDDWGRCEAVALRLKARVWPMNDTVSVTLVGEAIGLFAEVGLIECYIVDGHTYLAYLDHIEEQNRFAVRPSRIPDPVPNPILEPLPAGLRAGLHAGRLTRYIETCRSWRVKLVTVAQTQTGCLSTGRIRVCLLRLNEP